MACFLARLVIVCSWLAPFASSAAQDAAAVQDQAAAWTWVLAASLEEEENAELSAFARRMFDFYQGRAAMKGRLVPESTLEAAPSGPTVFLGPADGFRHPEWLAPLLRIGGIGGATVTLGGRTFADPETGIYVRNADGTRLAYTGTTGVGFRQIFGVRTGRRAATVTLMGRVELEGDHRFGDLELKSTGFFPALPSPEALEKELGPVKDALSAVDLSPVHANEGGSGLADEFQRRLGALVEEPRVLFFGESHWNGAINRLFLDVLGWLLQERRISTLFLETSYSHSAHFDHYVTIASDEEAERFWKTSLRPLVISALTRELLDSVRVWNRESPESRVVVACLDAEFDFRRTLEDALAAYFRAIDSEFEVELPERITSAAVLKEIGRLRGILGEHESAASPLPWMSSAFVGNALTNLEEAALVQGGARQLGERQRSILRNITEFHGDRFVPSELERGLVVFKMGAAHADRTAVRQDGTWWEAPYLDQRFEPTRGQVATMMVGSIGYDFDDVRDVMPETHKAWARNYNDFVESYRSALRGGKVEPGQFFHIQGGELTGVEKVVLHRAYVSGERALLLNVVAEDGLVAAGLLPSRRPWKRFDEVVYVVGGKLEAPLLKVEGR
ncbi:hypothetical protein Poly30_49280 [Planctomycetes bacterium Poly30]|uniref:Haem-binding uptake Tiki superfamily ChaN domain-containing protein n=1 Tax=Saltatorellus ferox TaxID=2528018 RepID=A0A518EZ50_9BACT|nr:hypothetical protein Poly30_49280 [Planctomycetes bacterium Poly30]